MKKLKKGKYYVGDPCYIFKENWIKVLHDTHYFDDGEIVKVFNEDCIAGGTAFSDGMYLDNYNREYYVDAGLLGVLPVSLLLIDNLYTVEEIEKAEGMHIIEFKNDFEVSIDNGIFKFDTIIIDTLN